MSDVDLEGGLEGADLEGRRTLLAWLRERGATEEELQLAAREHRLALLPTELILRGGRDHTLPDAARAAGLEPEFVQRTWRTAGIPIPPADEPIVDDADLEPLRTAAAVLAAGLSQDAYIDISRIVGRGAAAIADVLVEVSVREFLEPGEGEAEFAMRLQEIAEQLVPMLPQLLAFPVRMHLRDAIRHHALEGQGVAVENLAGSRRMAVAFSDLVGFTELSERLSLQEADAVAARLEEAAARVTEPPVRLVKLIGDAVMLTADEPADLTATLRELHETASDDKHLPELRSGMAYGEIAPRAGDLYGPPVNLASRLAGIAEPGQILASPDAGEALRGKFQTDHVEPVEIKGVGLVAPVAIGLRE